MKSIIDSTFKLLAILFNEIPLLNKFKGYRSVIGFIGLAIVYFLKMKGIGSPQLLEVLNVGFMGFSALALNAKNNDV